MINRPCVIIVIIDWMGFFICAVPQYIKCIARNLQDAALQALFAANLPAGTPAATAERGGAVDTASFHAQACRITQAALANAGRRNRRPDSRAALSNPRIRVFIVDDHPLIRSGLAAMVNAEPVFERVDQSLPYPFHPPARRVV